MTNTLLAANRERFASPAWYVFVLFVAFAFSAPSALLMEEGFNYPANTNLVNVAPWTGSSTGAIQVVSGGLTWTGLPDTVPSGNMILITNDANGISRRTFTGIPVTNGSVYFSMLLDCSSTTTNLLHLASLLVSGSTSASGGNDALALYLGSNAIGSFSLTVSHRGDSARAAKPISTNVTHLIVVKYGFTGSGQSTLYIDPPVGKGEPATPDAITSSDESDPVSNLQQVALKAPSSTTPLSLTMDTLRIGTEWADVVQWPIPVYVSGPPNPFICPGDPAVFTVTALGTRPFLYQWRANGSPMAGATDSSYTIPAPGTNDTLVGYDVMVTNAYGWSTSRVAKLSFRALAGITTQPAVQVVQPGVTSVTFRVVASGTGPLSYQWRTNGVPITGAFRSTFSITNPPVSMDQLGFDVVVSNACAVVTSAPPAQLLFAHAFYLADGLPGFISGMNLFTTNGPGMTMYVWSSADPHQSITNWTMEGQLSEQPLNDGSGNSRYSINVTSASSPTYYIIGQSVAWPYVSPAPVAWITTDSLGNESLLTAMVTILPDGTLVFPTGPALTGPANQVICTGNPATFSVAAQGTPAYSYQWLVSGVAVPNATNSAYMLTNPGPADALKTYSVLVTDYFGPTTSRLATLTIQVPPGITTQPVSKVVPLVVSNVTFSVVGNGTTPLSYQWLADGGTLAGATQSALTLTNPPATVNPVAYSVVLTNACGAITSAPALLIFPHPFFLADALPGFFSGMNLFTTNGPGISLFVWSSADPHQSVTNWTLEGQLAEQPLNDGTGNSRYSINVNPAVSPTYYIIGESVSPPYVSPTSVGWITTDSSGNENFLTATVTILPDGTLVFPTGPALTGPANQVICAGNPATFAVTAQGTPPLSYQWLISGAPVSGGTDSAYSLSNPSSSDALKNYAVVVTDYFGPTTSRVATLTIQTPPGITTPPSSLVMNPGISNATFQVVATGTAPLSYQWRTDGSTLAGSTRSSLALTNPTPTVNPASYDVVISNVCGIITSTPPAQLIFPHAFYAADGLPGFFSGMNIFTTNRPGMALYVWSSADPLSSVTNWTLEGPLAEQPLNDGTGNSRYSINVNPYSSPTYYIIGVSVTGPYVSPVPVESISTDGSGNLNLAVVVVSIGPDGILNYPVPPQVITQPMNRTVVAGQIVSFSASATGTAPLAYQWYFNTNTILKSGTNASLALAGVTASNAGAYQLVVTNAFGSATSAVATLTIAAQPRITARLVAGGLQITWIGVPGEIYWVQATTNLNAPIVWTTLATNIADASGLVQYVDTNTLAFPSRFYRLAIPPVAPTAPALLAQPASLTLLAGQTAQFGAMVCGSYPLAFQWYFDSITPLNGATNSALTLAGVNASQAGDYSLTASNADGSVTTGVAHLTVLPVPQLDLMIVSNNLQFSSMAVPGSSYWLQMASNMNPPVQWASIATNVADLYGMVQFSLAKETGAKARFFRMVAP
jgi:hypothetical protein